MRNVYEILNEFKNTADRNTKINLLRHYAQTDPVLKDVLFGAFHPFMNFVIKDLPKYKTPDCPPGMAYSHMSHAISKSYLFIENHPRAPAGLTMARRIQLLQQLLESLEEKEAEVYGNMLLKDLKVEGLTKEIVDEAFPGIFA